MSIRFTSGVQSVRRPLVLLAALVTAVMCGLFLVPRPAHAQEGAITSPGTNESVSGVVAVRGYAEHPTFRKWQLDLLHAGQPVSAHFLALGEKPVPDVRLLTTFDSRHFPDGDYLLRLRVVHSNLNYEEILLPLAIQNGDAPADASAAAAPLEGETPAADAVSAAAAVTNRHLARLAESDDGSAENEEEAADADEEPSTAAALPAPVFRTDVPDGERWIAVDISEQKLIAYQGETPVFETIVSTGKPGWRTLPGTFAVYLKYDKTRMRGPGYDTPDVPWTMFYSGDFAIHGAYWHNNFGTPVSHGCVNLRVEEAKALFEWAPMGTRVVVTD